GRRGDPVARGAVEVALPGEAHEAVDRARREGLVEGEADRPVAGLERDADGALRAHVPACRRLDRPRRLPVGREAAVDRGREGGGPLRQRGRGRRDGGGGLGRGSGSGFGGGRWRGGGGGAGALAEGGEEHDADE